MKLRVHPGSVLSPCLYIIVIDISTDVGCVETVFLVGRDVLPGFIMMEKYRLNNQDTATVANTSTTLASHDTSDLCLRHHCLC